MTSASAASCSRSSWRSTRSSRSPTRPSGSSVAAQATSRASHSRDLLLELFDPALAVVASLPVPAARRLELRLQPLGFRPGPQQDVLVLAAGRLHGGDLGREPLDLAFQVGAVVARLVGLACPGTCCVSSDGGVGDQALGDVEPEERLHGRPQHLAAGLVLGERADLLGVEEEELRDLQREEVLDELAPVLGVPAVGQAVERDLELLPHLAALHGPGPADLVDVLLAARRVAERDRDPRPFAPADAVVDRLAEELVVREVGPLRAPGPRAVEGKLDRVEQRRLAGAVGAAEQDDRPHPRVARAGHGRQVEVCSPA